MPAEVPAGPAAQDARPIDRREVNRPRRRRSHLISSANDIDDATEGTVLPARKAMEGTVLRVPCELSLPPMQARSRAWACGFWRSSVRGSGPPPSKHSATGSRLPPCVVSHADPPPSALPHNLGLIALRVTRMNARTRCRPPVAYSTTASRVAASPPVGGVAGAPLPIPMSVLTMNFMPGDDTSDSRDVSTAFEDVLNVPKRP